MEKREYEVLWNYYYGMSKVEMIWNDKLKKLDDLRIIKRIYEVIDKEYEETWYLIRDTKETSYIIKSKRGNYYSKDFMKLYKNRYKFYQITTDLINMYDDSIYPIVFRLKDDTLYEFYNIDSNTNYAFFNNYYCYHNNLYIGVRIYRNKVESERFEKEEDAIYWCSNYALTKEYILSNNKRPLNIEKMVYKYEI